MRRVAVVAVLVAAAATAAVVAAVTRNGDDGGDAVASVAGRTITREQLDLTLDHFREEAEREGRPFPDQGTAGYDVAQKQALALLVDRTELEVGAKRLGIEVTRDQVDARLAAAGTAEEEGGSVRVRAEAAFARATARQQLLTEAVYARVTAGVRVTAAEVRDYYRSRRRLYGTASFASVAPAIRNELTSARRNAAMARWRMRLRRTLAPSVRYEKLD